MLKLIFKTLIVLLLLFYPLVGVQAQDINKYTRLKCEGDIPLDISTNVFEKIEKDVLENNSHSEKRSVRLKKNEFILESGLALDELLTNGSILYGDKVTNYVNSIADKVLENDPELRSELRFYCVKSKLVNAFATHQGMIFITLGLISELEDEAQLAFIISHEIIHYKNKHSINKFSNTDETLSDKRKMRRLSYDDKIILLSDYSKKLELESDSLGFLTYKDVGYSTESAYGVFDVLQFSHLPYFENEIDYSLFENDFYKIPEDIKLEESIPVNFEVDEEDSKSSHPNLNLRRLKIKNLIDGDNSGEKFQIGTKEEFLEIREVCRNESIRLNLQARNFVDVYYNSIVVQGSNKDESSYLQNTIFKALYGISMYKMSFDFIDNSIDYEDTEGSISDYYYLFEKMNEETALALALREGWLYYIETNDSYTKNRLKSLIEFGKAQNIFNINILKSTILEKEIKTDTIQKTDVKIEKSKYDKLRELRGNVEYEVKDYYLLLKGIEKQDELISFIEKTLSDYTDSSSEDEEEKGFSAEKIAIINPVYYNEEFGQIDREKNAIKVLQFNKQIEKCAKASELNIELLDPKIITNTQQYNDISNFNYWSQEYYAHAEEDDDWGFIASGFEYLEGIKENTGTNYLAYTGVISYASSRKRGKSRLMYGLLFPYIVPYSLYYILSNEPNTVYYLIVYDIETGEKVLENFSYVNNKDNQSNINSLMYDMFLQIKNN